MVIKFKQMNILMQDLLHCFQTPAIPETWVGMKCIIMDIGLVVYLLGLFAAVNPQLRNSNQSSNTFYLHCKKNLRKWIAQKTYPAYPKNRQGTELYQERHKSFIMANSFWCHGGWHQSYYKWLTSQIINPLKDGFAANINECVKSSLSAIPLCSPMLDYEWSTNLVRNLGNEKFS